uniref:Uncharacterized protein n=1 Tax=Anguilla anguilla TaxID=7936 RepID=A0A0E9SGJ6_ANGAN
MIFFLIVITFYTVWLEQLPLTLRKRLS